MKQISLSSLVLLFFASLVQPILAQTEGRTSNYRIGPRDLIEVRVFETQELNGSLRVSEDGEINLPLVGSVIVAGLTETEAAERIKGVLEQKALQRASVSVQVQEFRSRPIAVIGSVRQPGNLAFAGRWTLLEALTAAGGLTDSHGAFVHVLRRSENGLADQVSIRTDDLFTRADPRVNIPIQPGDLVNVPGSVEVTVYCMGEVEAPGAVTFKSSERISLLTVIARAGGLTNRAASKISIKRTDGQGKTSEIAADYKKILAGKESDIDLQVGDVVVVKESFFLSVSKVQPFFPDEPDQQPAPAQETEFNIAEYIGMVRRHWKLVSLLVLVALVAAGVHYAITPKEYMASATIQIERRNLTPVGGTSSPWYENFWNMEFYPTQYELLQSRGLAERVVRSLDLMSDPAFNPGASAEKGTPGATTAEEDEATLGHLALQLKGGLAVEPVRNTQLVRLSYRSSSPEFAARAANAFAESFIDMGVEDRYASAGKASTFLSSQIETLKQEVGDKEAQLQAFSRTSDIVTLDPKANDTLQRLESLNGALMDAKKARIEKEALLHQVSAGPPEAVADSLAPGVISGLRTQQIELEQEYETKLKTFKPEWPEMSSLKTRIAEGQRNIDAVVREMVQKARSNANSAYQSALRQEQSLASELESIKEQAIDQSSSAVQFTNLKVEIETRRELLDELMRQQSETEVAVRLQDTRESNVRIIDQALMPGGPFRPSLRKDLTYGLLLGLLLGIGAALLIELLDRTVKTPEEVERKLGIATLAVVQDIADVGKTYGYSAAYGSSYGDAATGEQPRVRAGKGKGSSGGWLERKKGAPTASPQIELVPHERPRTLISESYRSLRTALLLSSARELKLVAVTSAMAGEGKTATAANLAVVLAQLGRPVIIMDCDLRKPRLHQVFKVSNRAGLVNQLTGTAELDAVIVPTEVPNLWVLPSGPMPPNPSELLASERLRDLLRTLRGRFEYVIVDTPPALAVTDATLVGALADGVVLTLRSHKVTREEARLVRDRLRQADIKILGAVLNRYRALQAGVARGYRYPEAYGYGAEESGSSSKAGSAA